MKKAETESPIVEGGLARLERKIWWGRWGGFGVDGEGTRDEPNRVPYSCQFRGVDAKLLVQGVHSGRGGVSLRQIKGQEARLNRESLRTHCRPDTVPAHPMGNSGEKLAHCLLSEYSFGQKWPSPSTPTLCSPLSWPQSCLDLEGILQPSSKFFLDRVSKLQSPPPNPPR